MLVLVILFQGKITINENTIVYTYSLYYVHLLYIYNIIGL